MSTERASRDLSSYSGPAWLCGVGLGIVAMVAAGLFTVSPAQDAVAIWMIRCPIVADEKDECIVLLTKVANLI